MTRHDARRGVMPLPLTLEGLLLVLERKSKARTPIQFLIFPNQCGL